MGIPVIFDIEIDLPGTEELIRQLNLEPSGKAQQIFTKEIIRRADKYVPSDAAGVLKNSAMPAPDYESIIYTAPYARYHWFGKKMVDPQTGKASFYDPKSGRHWSRPGIQKVLTDEDMQYQGAPLRGPYWVERMWESEGQEIIDATALFIERNKKI